MNKGIPPRQAEFDTEEEWKFAVSCWFIFFLCYACLAGLATKNFFDQMSNAVDVETSRTEHFDFPSIKVDVCETTHSKETLLDRLDAQMFEWRIYPDETKTEEVLQQHPPRYYEHGEFRCLRFDNKQIVEKTAVLAHTQVHLRILENETTRIPEDRLSFGPAWQAMLQNKSRLANGFYIRISLAEDELSPHAMDNEEMVPRLIPSEESNLRLVMPAFGKVHKSTWKDDLPASVKHLFGEPEKPTETFWFETSEFQTMAGSTKGGTSSQHIASRYPLIVDIEVLDTNIHTIEYMLPALECVLSYLGKIASYTILFACMGLWFPFKVPIIRRSRIPILQWLDAENPAEKDPLLARKQEPLHKEPTNTWEAC